MSGRASGSGWTPDSRGHRAPNWQWRERSLTGPTTALASVYGMNVIVNDATHPLQLALVLMVMAVMSGLLLRWTRKQCSW